MSEQQRAESADIELYAKGLDFAADVAHAEARWQTELAMRTDDMRERAKHRYAADRAARVETAIRGVAACSRPWVRPDEGSRSGGQIGKMTDPYRVSPPGSQGGADV